MTVPTLTADGFDEAIIGVVRNHATGQEQVVYSVEKCIDVLAKDMSPEEAAEYFWFNVDGAYMGEGTPLFMYPYDAETINEENNDAT